MSNMASLISFTSWTLIVFFTLPWTRADTIMVPGIGFPPAKLSVLGGLLGPGKIIERQLGCSDPFATLCPGDFCCALGSVCQPNNREFGHNCCLDTDLNCNGGTACCPEDSVCCSLDESPTGCCIFTVGGGGSPPPPATTTRKTTAHAPTTHTSSRTASKTTIAKTTSIATATKSEVETFSTTFPDDIPTFLLPSATSESTTAFLTTGVFTQPNIIQESPPTFTSAPTIGPPVRSSAYGWEDSYNMLFSAITAMNVFWAIASIY